MHLPWPALWRVAKRITLVIQLISGALVLMLVISLFASPKSARWVIGTLNISSISFGGDLIKVAIAHDAAEAQKATGQVEEGTNLALDAAKKGDVGAVKIYLEQIRSILQARERKALTGIVQALVPNAIASTPISSEPKNIDLMPAIKSQGWILVGTYRKDGALLADATDGVADSSRKAVRLVGPGKFVLPKDIVLTRTTTVYSDGNACPDWSKVKQDGLSDISKFEPPIAQLSAAPEPIAVQDTNACPLADGDFYMVYAFIDLPPQRVVYRRLIS